VIAMGVFGYGEIINNLSKHESERQVFTAEVKGLMPTLQEFKDMTPAVLRGTALGSALGILPGGGAAMAIHNIQPGPQVLTTNPELFWGLIASMWIGNLMLAILNLPLIGIWIKLLSVHTAGCSHPSCCFAPLGCTPQTQQHF
jgi:TctA family transporter